VLYEALHRPASAFQSVCLTFHIRPFFGVLVQELCDCLVTADAVRGRGVDLQLYASNTAGSRNQPASDSDEERVPTPAGEAAGHLTGKPTTPGQPMEALSATGYVLSLFCGACLEERSLNGQESF
jgi:hypothetical protein